MDHYCIFTGCFLFLEKRWHKCCFHCFPSETKSFLLFLFFTLNSHHVCIKLEMKVALTHKSKAKKGAETRWVGRSFDVSPAGMGGLKAHMVQMTVVSWAASCNVSTSGSIYYSYPRRWLQEVCISESTVVFWLQVTQELKSHQSKKVHGRRKKYQYIAYI